MKPLRPGIKFRPGTSNRWFTSQADEIEHFDEFLCDLRQSHEGVKEDIVDLKILNWKMKKMVEKSQRNNDVIDSLLKTSILENYESKCHGFLLKKEDKAEGDPKLSYRSYLQCIKDRKLELEKTRNLSKIKMKNSGENIVRRRISNKDDIY
jgi:hypothetical protein